MRFSTAGFLAYSVYPKALIVGLKPFLNKNSNSRRYSIMKLFGVILDNSEQFYLPLLTPKFFAF